MADGTFSWSYASKPNSIFIDATNTIGGSYSVSDLEYVNSSTVAGTGYVIDDPSNYVTLQNYHNANTGAQASRSVTQNQFKESRRVSASIGSYVAAAATISRVIQLPSIEGEYELSVTITHQDGNHQSSAKYRIIWTAGASYNYATSEILGTILTVGPSAPTGLSVAVDTAGLVTVTATAVAAGSPSMSYYWRRNLMLA